MLIEVYCIRDEKQEGFGRPFFVTNEAMAHRAFEQAVSGGDKMMSEYPDDYVLYAIGIWDDVSGVFTGQDPNRVMNGFEALRNYRLREDRVVALQKEIDAMKGNGVDHATE